MSIIWHLILGIQSVYGLIICVSLLAEK